MFSHLEKQNSIGVKNVNLETDIWLAPLQNLK